MNSKIMVLISLLAVMIAFGCIQQPNTPNERVTVPILTDGDPFKGEVTAKITIVEFSDFECPYCANFYAETLPLIKKDYIDTGKVRFVYRDMPMPFHTYAQKAAEAAECADEQGKFWEYHNILYESPDELDMANLKKYASQIGLDTVQFNDCLESGAMATEVQQDLADARSYGVQGTPTFFINGIPVVGAQPYSVFQQLIEQELAVK
ncbi:MAG: DsbA family protein [Candidatus Micrarchaeota archaeon]